MPPISGMGIRNPKSARLGMVCMTLAKPRTAPRQAALRVNRIPNGTPMAIAADMEMSKTKAHRMLQMWTPPESSPPYEGGVAAASADGVVLSSDSTGYADSFPGCEEYDIAMDDPKFDIIYESDDGDEPGTDEQRLLGFGGVRCVDAGHAFSL